MQTKQLLGRRAAATFAVPIGIWLIHTASIAPVARGL
jgi:hypothetical protein